MSEPTIGLILAPEATEPDRARILSVASLQQSPAYYVSGDGWSAVSIGDGARRVEVESFNELAGIDRIVEVRAPYRLASRELFEPAPVIIGDGKVAKEVGGLNSLLVGVAPVAADGGRLSPEARASISHAAGGTMVFAGRVSSDSSDDPSATSIEQLAQLKSAAGELGMLICVEVGDVEELDRVGPLGDVFQVGHHSMQNFTLLRDLGTFGHPVIMRRGLGATIEEFLLAAEYLLAQGNGRVILCESGINARGSTPRPRFEINALPLLRFHTHLPLIADVSNATDDSEAIPAIARAAVAAGAEGLIVQVQSDGAARSTDGPIDVQSCRRLVGDLRKVARAVGRNVDDAPAVALDRPLHVGERNEVLEFADPTDVLRDTSGTLAKVIERATGEEPTLEVVRQERIQPPYPQWLLWRLRPEGELLVRWTRYRIGEEILTRNLAFVDFGRVDASILRSLENEDINVGELFMRSEIDRFGYEFGGGADRRDFESILQECHLDAMRARPYVWRRYIAATSGRAGFLIIETLPTVTWRRILRSRNASLRGGA